MDALLRGRVAQVTAAGRGIGAATARPPGAGGSADPVDHRHSADVAGAVVAVILIVGRRRFARRAPRGGDDGRRVP